MGGGKSMLVDYLIRAKEEGRADGIKTGKADGIKAGRAAGIKAGKIIGIKEGTIKIAKKLKMKKMN